MILTIIRLIDNIGEVEIKEDDLAIEADIEEEDLINIQLKIV